MKSLQVTSRNEREILAQQESESENEEKKAMNLYNFRRSRADVRRKSERRKGNMEVAQFLSRVVANATQQLQDTLISRTAVPNEANEPEPDPWRGRATAGGSINMACSQNSEIAMNIEEESSSLSLTRAVGDATLQLRDRTKANDTGIPAVEPRENDDISNSMNSSGGILNKENMRRTGKRGSDGCSNEINATKDQGGKRKEGGRIAGRKLNANEINDKTSRAKIEEGSKKGNGNNKGKRKRDGNVAVEHLTAKDRAESQTTAWQTVGKKLNQNKRNNTSFMNKIGGAVNSGESDRTRKQHDGGGKANKKGGDGLAKGKMMLKRDGIAVGEMSIANGRAESRISNWQAVGSRLKESRRDGACYMEADGGVKSSEEPGRSRKVNDGSGKGKEYGITVRNRNDNSDSRPNTISTKTKKRRKTRKSKNCTKRWKEYK